MTTVATHSPAQPWDDQRLALIASWRRGNPGRIPRMNRHDRVEASICQWLAAQNRRGNLISTPETITLNRIFPDWRRVRVDTFDVYLYEVSVFVDQRGAIPSAKSENANERRLGEWLARKSSRSKDGTLLLSEARALTEAIPNWRSASPGSGRIVPLPKRKAKPRQQRASWEDRMRQLSDFYTETHRPPIKFKPGEQVLAGWLMAQQGNIANGRLSVDQTHRILRLFMDNPVISFNLNAAFFQEGLKRLSEHYRSSGITSMTQPYEGPGGLWEWVESMNIFYYRDELTDAQVQSIDDVDTNWRESRRGR